ncbi:hypothetical protein AB833_15110 [Chromatiales bacterium (ex Bugula neritina AB1)]|nr:hypothetical protein AB833_15110 [Chromatiales bacterium (ex Bugula neritina AB1)]
MATPLQENREVRVYTALGDNALLFSSMSGSERLSTLYNYRLELISEDYQINLDDLLGTDITVELQLPPSDYIPQGSYRYFHGIVADCAHVGGSDEYAHYEFSIRPWFWLLTRTADCRIFQDMTVPDIIKQVFQDSGFTDFEDSLTGTYEPWWYCVQYRETDYNFLSRLMEQEGIYFYFKHEQGKHKLVLSDSYSAHGAYTYYDSVPYYPVVEGQMRERDYLHQWQLQKKLQPGKYAARDFNFETPKAKLLAQLKMPGKHAEAEYEVFDYPGEYPGSTGVPVARTGDVVVRHRIEELAAQHETISGGGNARGLCAGYLFDLTGCERQDQNREYLIVESQCAFSQDIYRSGSDSSFEFFGSISAMQSQQQYRAPRVTPKPMVQGPQTAIVVGPSGEEIWTDKYGRVKLQFHWDRYGESNENSSCWVRVSQVWAGQGWGSIHIPRIGHEVIVEFLEGDPDRPIITGRVYNGDNGVPYGLPANQTRSGIKSRSSKGGSAANYNEIRLEDKKDSEKIYVHAERDKDVLVENDSRERIYGHRHQIIGWEKIEGKGGDQKEEVKQDKHIKVHRHQTEHVGGDMQILIGGVDGDGNQDIVVKKDKKELIENDSHLHVEGKYLEEVDKNKNVQVGGDHVLKVSGSSAHVAGADHLIKGKNILVEGSAICLKVGGNSVTIDPSGVTIVGTLVKVNSGPASPVISKASRLSPTSPEDAKEAEPVEPALANDS